ncbi:MAG: hypothetical protein F6K24_50540 [Okeania sp. SIO2D1]|nr:hypothetical protein [Okeania sp. SIO2D1]
MLKKYFSRGRRQLYRRQETGDRRQETGVKGMSDEVGAGVLSQARLFCPTFA